MAFLDVPSRSRNTHAATNPTSSLTPSSILRNTSTTSLTPSRTSQTSPQLPLIARNTSTISLTTSSSASSSASSSSSSSHLPPFLPLSGHPAPPLLPIPHNHPIPWCPLFPRVYSHLYSHLMDRNLHRHTRVGLFEVQMPETVDADAATEKIERAERIERTERVVVLAVLMREKDVAWWPDLETRFLASCKVYWGERRPGIRFWVMPEVQKQEGEESSKSVGSMEEGRSGSGSGSGSDVGSEGRSGRGSSRGSGSEYESCHESRFGYNVGNVNGYIKTVSTQRGIRSLGRDNSGSSGSNGSGGSQSSKSDVSLRSVKSSGAGSEKKVGFVERSAKRGRENNFVVKDMVGKSGPLVEGIGGKGSYFESVVEPDQVMPEGQGKGRERDSEDKENENPMLRAVSRMDHYRTGDERVYQLAR